MANDDVFPLHAERSGRWSAAGKDRFAEYKGAQFGGYVIGLLVTAVTSEADVRGAPIAVTCSMMARVPNAPIAIATRRLRAGNTLEFWEASVVQDDGSPAVHAVVTLAERPAAAKHAWIRMPDAPAPETIARSTDAPPMVNSFDVRVVRGLPPAKGDGISSSWVREDDGVPMSYARLALFADMFAPRVFYAVGEPRPSSTVSFSLYYHATEDEIAATGDDFILQHGVGRILSAGTCDLSASLWRRDGLLLATTEQLCWVRV